MKNTEKQTAIETPVNAENATCVSADVHPVLADVLAEGAPDTVAWVKG